MMIIRILILVLTCLVSLNPISAEDLRIPVLVGQTGASQTFGRNESDGYKLAAEEWNAKGGVNGRRVVLEFEDTETVARKTMSAFQLQLARGAQVVLGPTWLDSFPALIPIARKKGVLLVTPSAAIEAFTEADRTWPVSFYHNSVTEIKVLAEALRKRNLSRLALVYEQEPFSEMLRKAGKTPPSNINSTSTFSLRVGFCRPSLRKILISETAPLVADVGVQAGESDFRAQLLKLRSQKVEAIIVFVWDQRSLLSLLQQITTSIPNIPLATIHDGSGWVEDPAFKPFLPRLTYTRFVLKDPSFERKFKARFGYTPILTASNAYDALNSVLSAFAAGHDTGEKCRNYLMNNQLDSVTFGSFRFNQDGSVPSIVEVVDYVSGK